MAQRNLLFIVAALAIVALLATIVGLRRQPETSSDENRNLGHDTRARPVTTSEQFSAQTEPRANSIASAFDRVNATGAQLAASTDREANRRLLSALRAFLETLPRETASREVQRYLDTGNDAATQLDLTIGPGGVLRDASSLRLFLLDYLDQIDRPASAALARQILRAPTSPDEWAISLRNVARADDSAATAEYLRGKAAELVANSAWQQNPSAGYLEAFDIVVHTRATEVAPQLTALIRDKENKAVAHAAYLTLDRLTIAEPAATLQQLADQPALMAGREQTRANFFARADVRDAQQRALLERYLLDPLRTPQELQTFAGIYPNANFMISNNLLTSTTTPTHQQLIEHDRAALATLEQWMGDPRFAGLKPQLEAMRARLRNFVGQASAAPGR